MPSISRWWLPSHWFCLVLVERRHTYTSKIINCQDFVLLCVFRCFVIANYMDRWHMTQYTIYVAVTPWSGQMLIFDCFQNCNEMNAAKCGERMNTLRVINNVKLAIWRTRFHMSPHNTIAWSSTTGHVVATVLMFEWCSFRRHRLHPRWLMHLLSYGDYIDASNHDFVFGKKNHHFNWNSRLVCACAACSWII